MVIGQTVRWAEEAAGPLPDLMAELKAMQKIVAALGELGDDEARRRVMRWANRFSPEAHVAPLAPDASVAVGSSIAPEPSDALESLVDPEAAVTPAAPVAQPRRHRDTMLSIEGLNLFEDNPSSSQTAAADSGREAPLESVIKSFVDQFQQVAREWQGA